MNAATDAARSGSIAYFEALPEDELARLVAGVDSDGRSLLHTAAASGSLQLTQLLANRGGTKKLDDADDEGWVPLMSAVSAGHDAISEYLIGLGATVDAVNTGGRTSLHYAASKGKPSLIRLLLKHGAAIGRQDITGSTPLHRAASAGKAEAARVLIEEGRARLEVADRQGQTPLFVAVSCDQSNVAMYLAAAGANLEAITKEQETPLSVAGSMRDALVSAAAQHGRQLHDESME